MQHEDVNRNARNCTTHAEWFARIDEIGEELGHFQKLGPHHAAFFADDSQDALLVTFETADSIRSANPEQMPRGFQVARARGWSHLCLIADGDTWYRDPHVWGYFDRLVDDAFFEDFDQVVFYGAEMGGYAAAAFSVAAPGASVICVSPQATLDPRLSEWDNRFTQYRRLDFTSRYGFAPDMVEGAAAVYLFYDPAFSQDAMHAALFNRSHVHRIRCRHMSRHLENDLMRMNVLPEILHLAGRGALSGQAIHLSLRARRRYMPYLLRLLGRLEARERHGLTAMLARWALQSWNHPRLREAEQNSVARLTAPSGSDR